MDSELTVGVLDSPPFPTLHWDKYSWVTTVVLDAWAGVQLSPAFPDAATWTPVTDGTVRLDVETPGNQQGSPAEAQGAAYEDLLVGQQAARDAIFQAVFEAYPEHQKSFGFAPNEAAQFMPDISEVTELHNRIHLSSIHIFPEAKDDLAYVGYWLECTWDDEHGIGAMMHGGRIVEIGEGSVAVDVWIARKDAGLPIELNKPRKSPKPVPEAPIQLGLWSEDG